MTEMLHGPCSRVLIELDAPATQAINYEAARDFAKRSVLGVFIILLAMLIGIRHSNVMNDIPVTMYSLFVLLIANILSRYFILRALPKKQFVSLDGWKQLFSLIVLATGIIWGLFVAINLALYQANTNTLIIFMLTIGIAGGSAISLFIWRGLAKSYLLVLLLPTCIVAIFDWTDNSISILFAFVIYFIFLYAQIRRSNSEYWQALCNNKVLEIQAEQLKKAKENAEHANQAKSTFLSSMSHELRTPLNAVLGFSQLMANDPQHPPNKFQAESLDYIINAGKHLLSLINQVLDLTKIESGDLELNIRPVNTADFITQCTALLQPLASEKNVTIDIDQLNTRLVKADAISLKQILMNLISNAIKYNKTEGKVVISTEIDGDKLIIRISDTGVGIAQKDWHLLFQSFSRLAHDTTTEGTGIGLVITKSLVEAMQGELNFDSTEGVGSTFWFTLPLA